MLKLHAFRWIHPKWNKGCLLHQVIKGHVSKSIQQYLLWIRHVAHPPPLPGSCLESLVPSWYYYVKRFWKLWERSSWRNHVTEVGHWIDIILGSLVSYCHYFLSATRSCFLCLAILLSQCCSLAWTQKHRAVHDQLNFLKLWVKGNPSCDNMLCKALVNWNTKVVDHSSIHHHHHNSVGASRWSLGPESGYW